jgi:hypothetical protein
MMYRLDDALERAKKVEAATTGDDVRQDPYGGLISEPVKEGPEDFDKLIDIGFKPRDY